MSYPGIKIRDEVLPLKSVAALSPEVNRGFVLFGRRGCSLRRDRKREEQTYAQGTQVHKVSLSACYGSQGAPGKQPPPAISRVPSIPPLTWSRTNTRATTAPTPTAIHEAVVDTPSWSQEVGNWRVDPRAGGVENALSGTEVTRVGPTKSPWRRRRHRPREPADAAPEVLSLVGAALD